MHLALSSSKPGFHIVKSHCSYNIQTSLQASEPKTGAAIVYLISEASVRQTVQSDEGLAVGVIVQFTFNVALLVQRHSGLQRLPPRGVPEQTSVPISNKALEVFKKEGFIADPLGESLSDMQPL